MEHKHEQARTPIQWRRSVSARAGSVSIVIRPKLGPDFKGKYVAIDIETGDYEIADDPLDASHALIARKPDVDIWMQRVGYCASVSFGGGTTRIPMVTGSVNAVLEATSLVD